LLGPEHAQTVKAEVWLGQNLAESGRHNEAGTLFFHAIKANEGSCRSKTLENLETMVWLGMSLTKLGANDVAHDVLQPAVTGLRHYLGPQD
jgi:TolA-binding protein